MGKESVGINTLPPDFKGLEVNGFLKTQTLDSTATSSTHLKTTITTYSDGNHGVNIYTGRVLSNVSTIIEHVNGQSGIAFTTGGAIAVKKRGTWEWL